MRRMSGGGIVLAVASLLFSSCVTPLNEPEITFASPKKGVALAFFDQAKNPDFITFSTSEEAGEELLKNYFDVVVTDAVDGLSKIKAGRLDFALERILTSSNYYLVSVGEENKGIMPAEGSFVMASNENDFPDLVYRKLANDYWTTTDACHYVKLEHDRVNALKTGSVGGEKVDYAVVSEPELYEAVSDEGAATYGTIHLLKDIRAEWKAHTGQGAVPGAGLFVRKSSLQAKPRRFKEFKLALDARIVAAKNDMTTLRAALDDVGDEAAQVARFGLTAELAVGVQSGSDELPKNGFGLISQDEQIRPEAVNAFLHALDPETYGETSFDESLFTEMG